MLTLLMLGIMTAASQGAVETQVDKPSLAQTKTVPWFSPRVQPFAPAFLAPQRLETVPPMARDFPDEQHPEVTCTLRIHKADL